MDGWSFHVGLCLWPPSVTVEFCPAVDEVEWPTGSVGSVSDTPFDVDDCDGTYMNRYPMGFAPSNRGDS